MINNCRLNLIKKSDNIHFNIYNTGKIKLYIIGNDSVIKSAILSNNTSTHLMIEKDFSKGLNSSIKGGIDFLNKYFNDRIESFRKIKYEHINSSITLYFNNSSIDLDLTGYTHKEISIYKELLRIPFGKTISYGEISENAKIPSGARFVGNTMAKNNFPIFIPCHRVIKSNGDIGNYSGGIHVKEALLKHEGFYA